MDRLTHGKKREGRISSSIASLLLKGTKGSWERLADILHNPPPFHAATQGAMAEGVRRESTVVARFAMQHPEILVIRHPAVIYHHDTDRAHHDRIIASPDRIVDGVTLEVKWATNKDRFEKLAGPAREGYVPSEHRDQVEWQMWCNGSTRGWFAVAGAYGRYQDVLYEKGDLSHIDALFDAFMGQFKRNRIMGMR